MARLYPQSWPLMESTQNNVCDSTHHTGDSPAPPTDVTWSCTPIQIKPKPWLICKAKFGAPSTDQFVSTAPVDLQQAKLREAVAYQACSQPRPRTPRAPYIRAGAGLRHAQGLSSTRTRAVLRSSNKKYIFVGNIKASHRRAARWRRAGYGPCAAGRRARACQWLGAARVRLLSSVVHRGTYAALSTTRWCFKVEGGLVPAPWQWGPRY